MGKRKKESSSASRTKRTQSSRSRSSRTIPSEEIPSMGKRIGSLIWNVTFYGVFISVLMGAVLFNLNSSPDKSFFGYRFMTVKTNSMSAHQDKPQYTDGFDAGDLIILQSVPPDELKVDDIITFHPVATSKEAFLTHRLIETGVPVIDETGDEVEGLMTQGDANDNPDIPILKTQLVGKVIGHIPYIGRILQFMRDNLTIVIVCVSLVFMFIATIKYYLSIPKNEPKRTASSSSSKKRRRRQPT